jgi:hypothetical protein
MTNEHVIVRAFFAVIARNEVTKQSQGITAPTGQIAAAAAAASQ